MANIKISQLTSLSTMTDSSIIPVVASGSTQQISGANLKSYFTGSVGFVDNAIYDLGGVLIENADLSHGATAALIIPPNGDANSIQMTNTYGNIAISAGASAVVTASWTFGSDGNLTVPGGIVGAGNLQLQPDGNIGGAYLDVYLTAGPDIHIASNGANFILGRDAGANVTVGVDGNVSIQATSGTAQNWKFDVTGNLTVPDNMHMQTTAFGFPFSSAIVGITTGDPTVSVVLADDIFPAPVTGQVTIRGVVGTTEANDTWWFQANEVNSIELFTDSTFSTPVDGTTWTAYVSDGFAVSAGSADMSVRGGNVSVTSGAWTWTFDAAGNLGLPSGGSIENRDNKSILITNTTVLDGEITIEANADVNIYGGSSTTPGSSGGRVNIAGGWGGPDSGSGVGNGGWVEISGGLGANAINDAAGIGGQVRIVGGTGGNANSGNSILAETGGIVYIFGGQAGDVDGNNALAVGGPDVEIHGGLGSFNGSTMVGRPGDVLTQGGGNGWIGASGNVLTKTSPDGYDFYVWKYDNAGRTIYPTLSTQRGDNPSGTISGYTIRIGDGAAEAIITTPDGDATANPNSQRLVINPGAGAPTTSGEGGDIYLWAGRGGSASGSGGDIKIRGGQGGSNADGGGGGDGGYIRIEAGDTASTGGYPGYVEITGGTAAAAVGGYIHILAGTGDTGGGAANITGGYAQTGHGGQVNITGGISADGLGSYGNVVISAGASTLTFDNTGNLTFPNGDIITNGAFNGTASSSVSLNAFSPDGNTVSFIAQGNTSLAVIQTYNSGTDTKHNWTFNNTGILATDNNLTLQTPSGIPSTVTAITGSSGSWEANPRSDLATTGGTGTGLTVDVTETGGYASTIAIHTPGTGYTNGDTITVTSGSSNATFTISVLANSWTFGTDGNFSLNGSNIAGGTATVVTDGINSIALGLGATMDVYGFPFSGPGIRGQLTISGITSTTQANGTWYYQSTGTYIYQLYTDSTYTTKVDASGWTAYTGGGSVAITKQSPASNVVINSNGYFSTFANNGSLNLPGSLTAVGDFGTDGDIYGNNIAALGIVKTGVYTLASLPSASEVGAGARAFVTDADSNVFGTIYGGDSGNSVPVWSNGTSWYIG